MSDPQHQPEKQKPPPLQISPWDPWLDKWGMWIVWGCIIALFVGLGFARGRWDKSLTAAVVFLILGGIKTIFWLIQRRREIYEPPPRPAPPTPTHCLHCNYDLRATPLRCPECGQDTILKIWLDERPVEKFLYEKRLKPVMKPPPGKKKGGKEEG